MSDAAPAGPHVLRSAALELVTIEASDGFWLDAALYAGERGGPAVVLLHGKTQNFYSGPSRFLPPVLAAAGYTCLALNMRCHDLGYTRDDLPYANIDQLAADRQCQLAGGAWEHLESGHLDVGAGVDFLRARGHRAVGLIGHSSGGFYAVDYAARDASVGARVLLSPLTTNTTPLRAWFPQEAERERVLSDARAMVARGEGHRLIPLPAWYYAISAASLLDRVGERPGWFDEALLASQAPLLLLWGAAEDRGPLWDRYFAQVTAPKARVVIPGAEHAYLGQQAAVAEAVRDFLDTCLRERATTRPDVPQ